MTNLWSARVRLPVSLRASTPPCASESRIGARREGARCDRGATPCPMSCHGLACVAHLRRRLCLRCLAWVLRRPCAASRRACAMPLREAVLGARCGVKSGLRLRCRCSSAGAAGTSGRRNDHWRAEEGGPAERVPRSLDDLLVHTEARLTAAARVYPRAAAAAQLPCNKEYEGILSILSLTPSLSGAHSSASRAVQLLGSLTQNSCAMPNSVESFTGKEKRSRPVAPCAALWGLSEGQSVGEAGPREGADDQVARQAYCCPTLQFGPPPGERGSAGQVCGKGVASRQYRAATLVADSCCAPSWRLMWSVGPDHCACGQAADSGALSSVVSHHVIHAMRMLCVNIASCNSLCVARRHLRDVVIEQSCRAGVVASEAANTVLQCFLAKVRRWRELAYVRAAALECSQAPLAIPSRKWPRCLIRVTHASWPLHSVFEFVWTRFSHRCLLCLAACAACWSGLGLKTTPVVERRHVSHPSLHPSR